MRLSGTNPLVKLSEHPGYGLLTVAMLLVVHFVVVGNRQVDMLVERLSSQGQVLTISGGDVSLRDAPTAQDLMHGRFFADPYYAHESNWYPFMTPLIAAVVTLATGSSLPEAYFRAEPIFLSVFLVAVGLMLFRISRWSGLLVTAAALLLHLIPTPGSIYPAYSARGFLCATLVWTGYLSAGVSRKPQSVWRFAAAGGAVGSLGIWHGASFFIALGIAVVFLAGPVATMIVRKRLTARRGLASLTALVFGVCAPMALLIVPQLLKYGTVKIPQAARAWIETGIYGAGGLSKALLLSRGPSALQGTLICIAIFRLVLAPRLGLKRDRLGVLLIVAYAASLFAGHLGFLVVDRERASLAALARAILPAPPHTFLVVADMCAVILSLVGAAALIEMAAIGVSRFLASRRPSDSLDDRIKALRSLCILAIVAMCGAAAFVRPDIARHQGSEPREFVGFAKSVGETVRDSTVFFRYPGRFLQHVAIKIPLVSLDYYANPYVHQARSVAIRLIDDALAQGDLDRASDTLVSLGVAYTMEHPRQKDDPVIRLCSGRLLMEYGGYVLREFARCHR